MNKLRKIFTRWYVKRGYTFGYDFTDVAIFDDGFMRTPVSMPRAVWDCPWWVRPLLIFWSPSTYYHIKGEVLSNGFIEGLQGVKLRANDLQKEIDAIVKGE